MKAFYKIKALLKESYNQNVVLNILFKLVVFCLSFISVRVSLNYLGKSIYGLWVTITSVVSWMASGDLGIGNGLRNELSKAYAERDNIRIQKLVSTSVRCMVKISFILLLIFVFLTKILIDLNIIDENLRTPMNITNVFFALNLIVGLSQSISFSFQQSWLNTMASCVNQILIIIVISVFNFYKVKANITTFSVFNGFCLIIPNIIVYTIIKSKYYTELHHLNFKRNNKDKAIIKSIISVGLTFFGLQICGLILYSTDYLIINKILSDEMVTKYNLITKVYDAGNSIFSVFLIALWSAVTYHFALKEYQWIKKKVNTLIIYWIFYSFGVIIASLFFNNIVTLWIGKNAPIYEPYLIGLFASYTIMIAFSAIFVNVINGLGKIKIQLSVAIIGAIINIPLSIYFAKNCDMGIIGVKLATFICQFVSSLTIAIQGIVIMRKWPNSTNSNNI